jgi:cell division protein FtsB
MKIKRAPLIGAVGIILIIILLLTTIYYKNESEVFKADNNTLNTTIIEQQKTIEALEEEKNNLEIKVSELEKKSKSQALTSKSKITSKVSSNDFKSYMSYKAITNKASKQWEIQQNAYTNKDGFRCIDGVPLVAVGTGWGLSVGDTALITCENGNSFNVVVGDIKADQHTAADNKTTLANNCRCEFIVDTKTLNNDVSIYGNAAVLEEYSGYVIDIQKQ